MSTGSGIGGYASMYLAPAHIVISIETRSIDPALGVSVIPNAAMAHAALTRVARFKAGESILIHGALGGFAAGFPGMAKMLGASRIVGTVRASKLDAANRTKLPYDLIVDSARLDDLGDEKFDVIIDPVGGIVRAQSLDLMRAGSRLIVSGNASDDWDQQLKSNDLWLRNITVSGFNAGAYLPANPEAIGPGLEAGVDLVAEGLGNIELELFPLEQAVAAHRRMEDRQLNGRIVLTTE
ncbi:NADPH quinone reductase [Rhizobium sp. Root274]|nr:NADPH quinone reductase [Rhizobium sp. Root1240]KRD31761.1 NADPH quinone reductase [Rhizobium sp. Root274]